MGVSANYRGTLFWGPYNKDPTILSIILGSPIFGNSHIRICQNLWGVKLEQSLFQYFSIAVLQQDTMRRHSDLDSARILTSAMPHKPDYRLLSPELSSKP